MASASATMLTLFEDIELTTCRLMGQLGIEDPAEIHGLATEATGSGNEFSSEEYALRIQAQDLRNMLQIIEDHRLALSFDQGLEANYPSFRTVNPGTDPRKADIRRIDVIPLPVEEEVVHEEEYEGNEEEYRYEVHEPQTRTDRYPERISVQASPVLSASGSDLYEDDLSDMYVPGPLEILELAPSGSVSVAVTCQRVVEEEEVVEVEVEESQQPGPYVETMEQYVLPEPLTDEHEESQRPHARITEQYIPPINSTSPATSKFTPRIIRCVICEDQFTPGSALRAPCNHYYCQNCVINFVTASTRDESIFPPKCCDQRISSTSIHPFLSPDAQTLFICKTHEYGIPTAKRIYCPTPDCSAFLGSSEYYLPGEVTCGRCRARACVLCKQRAHLGDSCFENTVIMEVRALARTKGWQTCPECKAVIELCQGCFHMTCRCGAQFCYLCAAPWKQCSCPRSAN